ncbi:hypothetical protein PsorP6_017731 [Peronosclerospora sorghi]|uniref:Uncharacterized protein n=1 Tax=Peronosclerospora sorghi TaxID=230839 RepID=A0ACC0WLF4_9STRA|nr:hypothetical protein PsorP6_017731 [Peronosclerospora sorghi]
MPLIRIKNENSLLLDTPTDDKALVPSSVATWCPSIPKLGRTALTSFFVTLSISAFLLLHDAVRTANVNSNASIARFRINFPASVHAQPITGRLMVCIAQKHAVKDPQGHDQPRFLITDSATTQQMFAIDVWNFAPGEDSRDVNGTHAIGYPILWMDQVPADEYWVQAVLHPYVEYNRSDGWKLHLPKFTTFESDGGVLTAPGTLYSAATLTTFDPLTSSIDLTLTQKEPELPAINEPHELLKHVTFRSPMLSKFWGTDVYLKAWVLLPHRFYDEDMKSVHYPLLIYHTHYSRSFEHSFVPTPPKNSTTASLGEQYGYYFYSNWTSEKPSDPFTYKRGIIVQLQHANPYYDDSYAVNSANIGPYGDAITYEFLPFIEKKFRGIGKGWARAMYGGSTGGWESLAVQVYYPDEYNGCWSFCPDAFDFRRFQQVNLLKDKNAYYAREEWTRTDRGARRDYLGDIRETMAEENHHELAMGSRGRSGGQWDAWQAVYSPVNATDGYPAAIWDKLTGAIHPDVVAYWETYYDVRAKLQREWHATGLGRKLVNKIHVYVGVTDSYYLNDAVFLLEDFLTSTTEPYYNGSIVYGITDGRGFEHCWTGSFDVSISLAWYTINQRIVPLMVEHIVQAAPPHADLRFTSY